MVKVVVGMMGSSVSGGSVSMSTPASVNEYLDVLSAHSVREIDTARVYVSGKSEELLGAVSAHKRFAISTKAPAFSPGSLSKANILANCEKSLTALGVGKVDIYYTHGPDSQTPLEEQCDAIAQLHSAGKFTRFGVSNISASAVKTMHAYCKKNNYIVPSVYQGGYNPLNRTLETDLFPVLRELDMHFYAYSPLAGGLFAKKIGDILKPAKGSRYDAMKVFGDIYLSDEKVKGLEELTGMCEEQGLGVMEATMRWFMHHSPLGEGDAVVLGASTSKQIEGSLAACEGGPLPEKLVVCFDQLWEKTRDKGSA